MITLVSVSGEVFNAFARTGGKNGYGNADERDAVQVFFMESIACRKAV